MKTKEWILGEKKYRSIWFRIPFTLYFIAKQKNGYFCLIHKEFNGEEYYWRRI